MPPLPWSSLLRLDYSTGTTPLDRLHSLGEAAPDVALVNWPNSTPYCYGWDGRDHHDYEPLDAQLDSLVAARPGLRFILSFGALHGAPYYWALDHKDELGVFHCGRRMQQPSLGSLAWRRDSAAAARRFAAHFASGRHAARILGFFPYNTAVDWHGVGETLVNIPDKETPKGTPDPLEGDFSAPMLAAFRAYLENTYASDAALREAWRDASATRAGATLPARVEVRSPSPRARDYFECYNRLNADLALAWAEALKAGAPGKLVLLPHATLYGWPAQNIHPQGSGHNAPEALLASPAIDAFVSSATTPVGARLALSQHPLGSLRLRAKAHVHSIEPPSLTRARVEDQLHELTLAAGSAAVRGSALAWGEPRHGAGSLQDDRGRFATLPYDHAEVRAHVARLRAWHAAHLAAGHAPAAQLAVFTSPRGSYHRALETRFNREHIERFRHEVLALAGLPFDDFLLADFEAVADRYRAWVFLDCPDLAGPAWARVSREPARALFATAGEPVREPARLRAFAAAAGAHVWCASDDLVHADAGTLVFAARSAGEKTLALPRPATVRDALSGAVLATTATRVSFPATAGEVRLLTLA
jgi:hypothetical protein